MSSASTVRIAERENQVAAELIKAVQKQDGGATWSLRETVGTGPGLPSAGYVVSMPGRSLTLRDYPTDKLTEIVVTWLRLHRALLQISAQDTVDALDVLGELVGPRVGWTPAAPLGLVCAGAWWDRSRRTTVFDVDVLITSGYDAKGARDDGRHRAVTAAWFWGEHAVWHIGSSIQPAGGEEILCEPPALHA
jgi:hypothetical protein